METNKLTYLDVLNETIEFYSVDPINRRSVSRDGIYCYYFNNNKSCAVGRCIHNVEEFINEKGKYNSESAYCILSTFTTSIFKKEYQHLTNIYFWEKIQNLHDSNTYWNKNGLTPDGLDYKQNIINYLKEIN
jgi:hypothetical protein